MSLVLRRATPDDAETIQHHRDAMFLEMGADLAHVATASRAALDWTVRALRAGSYVGLLYTDPDASDSRLVDSGLAESGPAAVVAGCGVTWLDLPPNMFTTVARRGYVLNMYVEPGYRRRGLARSLLDAAVSVCHDEGVDLITLHASDAGRPLYAELGFVPTAEMQLQLSN